MMSRYLGVVDQGVQTECLSKSDAYLGWQEVAIQGLGLRRAAGQPEISE